MAGRLFYLLAIIQLGVSITNASEAITSTTQLSNHNHNTFTIRGANADILKATIYNNQRDRKRSNSNNNNNNYSNTPLPPPVVRQEDLPIHDQRWQSLNPDVEFIPAEGIDPQLWQRFLDQAEGEESESATNAGMSSKMTSIYNVESFAHGGVEYDEYQQAWRLLGFIIDCNPMVDDDYYAGGGSGSGDKGTQDGCARYVLWAAVRLKSACLAHSPLFIAPWCCGLVDSLV
jgi:hypothetical protein